MFFCFLRKLNLVQLEKYHFHVYYFCSPVLENSTMVLFADGAFVDTSLNSEFTFGTASVTVNSDTSFNVALNGGK